MKFSIQAWSGWKVEDTSFSSLPRTFRRRVTQLGQNALAAAWQQPALEQATYVFCSRHGEFSRTLSILRALAAPEVLSPAEFSMSVHHSLLALLSLATKNKNGHTALAAGKQSLAMWFCEALASLGEHPTTPVLLVYYDVALPGEYAEIDPDPSLNAVYALLLGHATTPQESVEFVQLAEESCEVLDQETQELLTFLEGGSQCCLLPSEGGRWLLRR